MTDAAPNVLAAALEAHDAGLCVIRARTDGTKAPLGKWEHYQHQRPSRDEVHAWFANGHPGLGVVCGNVSGDLEMFELEGRFMAEHADEFLARVKAAGIELLFRRLMSGFAMESPKGGRNAIYRVEGPVDGNTKLAKDVDSETLIETRGEGGFVVLAPSHGPTHPSGKPWRVRAGSVTSIPTITLDEREALFAVARTFDEAPIIVPPPPLPSGPKTPPAPWTGGQIGESWFDAVVAHVAATIDMRATLEAHGWTWCYTDNRDRQLLRRPGKDEGVSGSINENGRFCPFSTSVPFESAGGGKSAPTYDTLDVLAVYEHLGDRSAAARHYADATGILDAWKRAHTPDVTTISGPPSNVDPFTGEILASDTYRNLPVEFWGARPELTHIRQAAHARARSADAVLLFTLSRICATIPSNIRLPPIVGGDGSLNFLGAVIGTSGSGKSTAGAVARALVPIDRRDVLADLPLGSGEGLVEQYFEWVNEEQPDGKFKKVKRKTRDGLYMYLDEGQALGEMGSRKGATLLPTLRAAWSGETIGNANASAETHRVVPEHTYRMAMMVGFQAEHATGLLDDVIGGLPQRFVFASAVDTTVPDAPPEWPGRLIVQLPSIAGIMYIDVDPGIAAEIQARDRAATRGLLEVNPLDSHIYLVRLKVAALLGYLDGRLNVDPEDWGLAQLVMRSSCAVRGWVIEIARNAATNTEMSGHRRAATREVVIATESEKWALGGAARAVARRVHRGTEPVDRRDLTQAIAGKHRSIVTVDDAIEEAQRLRWIVPNGALGWAPGEAKPT